PCHIGDPDRPAELAAILAPGDEALEELAGAGDDMAGLLRRLDQSLTYPVFDVTRLAELLIVDDTDDADPDSVAQRVLLLDELRSRSQRHFLLVTQHDERDGIACTTGNEALDIPECRHTRTVDRDETVSRLEACLLGGTA